MDRRPRPAFANTAKARRLRLSRTGLAEWTHELRRQMKHRARLGFAGVIARLVDELTDVDARPPVDRRQKHAGPRLQLANHLAEVVAAVSVQDDELFHSLVFERGGDIAQHGELGLGFMLMVRRRSSWPVLTPKGTVGSTAIRAPRRAAMRADASAMASVSMMSVPYGR